MPASQFAAHLAVSPPVTGPLDFASRFEQWLISRAQTYIDTPEERDAVVAEVMKLYDSVGLELGKTSMIVGALFPLMRPTVEAAIRAGVNFLAPPAPVPTPPSIPQGATP